MSLPSKPSEEKEFTVLDASLSMASLGVPYVAMMGCTVAVCV